ncbi:MAG TPA: hypothetical protein VHC40_11965 [Rhizomicrobium sp.]|nr:hypothetical protein [Rhizomicrobium sp.]
MAVEAMKRYLWILACAVAVFAALAMPNAAKVHAQPRHLVRVADDSLCVDSMETEPDDDDDDTMLVALTQDGGCLVPNGVISI